MITCGSCLLDHNLPMTFLITKKTFTTHPINNNPFFLKKLFFFCLLLFFLNNTSLLIICKLEQAKGKSLHYTNASFFLLSRFYDSDYCIKYKIIVLFRLCVLKKLPPLQFYVFGQLSPLSQCHHSDIRK